MIKVYILSGELRVVKLTDNPLQACVEALSKYGNGKTIDHFFYLDEQGYREGTDARWAIPTEAVLEAGGYIPQNEEPEDGVF